MLVPVAAVAAVVAVVVGAYVLMAVTGASRRAAQAATVVVAARRAVALLEQERQQMIAIYDASRSTKVLAAPKIASTAKPESHAGSGIVPPLAPVDPGSARAAAENMMPSFGWSPSKYFGCLDNIWTRESGWRYNAENPSGAYGIPQALPGSKMATAGADWQTNPVTQIKWGLGYIQERYGDPCSAWSYWQAHDSY